MIATWLYAAGLAGAMTVGGFFYGVHTASNTCKADKLLVMQETQRRFDAALERYNHIAAQLETQRNEREASEAKLRKEIQRIIKAPIYRRDCFDADGVAAANRALSDHVLP